MFENIIHSIAKNPKIPSVLIEQMRKNPTENTVIALILNEGIESEVKGAILDGFSDKEISLSQILKELRPKQVNSIIPYIKNGQVLTTLFKLNRDESVRIKVLSNKVFPDNKREQLLTDSSWNIKNRAWNNLSEDTKVRIRNEYKTMAYEVIVFITAKFIPTQRIDENDHSLIAHLEELLAEPVNILETDVIPYMVTRLGDSFKYDKCFVDIYNGEVLFDVEMFGEKRFKTKIEAQAYVEKTELELGEVFASELKFAFNSPYTQDALLDLGRIESTMSVEFFESYPVFGDEEVNMDNVTKPSARPWDIAFLKTGISSPVREEKDYSETLLKFPSM